MAQALSRRLFLLTTAAALCAPAIALAQGPSPAAYSAEELAVAGSLGDKALGDPKATVVIYEYASLTCGACAAFHADGYKFLKEKYIDTGKVRFVMREFPLDPLATAGFMLARCAPESRYQPLVDLLFAQQRTWAFSQKPLDGLLAMARQAGFSQESFETCLKDQAIYDGVNEIRRRGQEKFAVDSTPTFFINGKRHTGVLSPKQLEDIIEPLLKI
ncbi:MAG: DsbA family protein [Beijerinckiaceae bacterium]